MQSRINLKSAVSVGIGLFIAFIGLQNANIVVGGSTLWWSYSQLMGTTVQKVWKHP